MRDVLELIRRDHAHVKELLREFDALGVDATVSRAKLGKKIVEELVAHDRAEEATVYGVLRERARERGERIAILQAYAEHEAAEDLVHKLLSTDPKDDDFVAKFAVLRHGVERHIKEEEGRVHPIARSQIPPDELEELGTRFEEAKKQVAV